MNTYCVSLNFNIPPLRENIVLSPHSDHIKKLNLKLINPKLTSIFDKLNVSVGSLQHLSYPPYFTGTIHIDNEGGDYIKCNWIYQGSNSIVNWYEPIDTIIKPANVISREYQFIKYDKSEVKLLYSQSVTLPSLIQVGIPHNVINFNEPRECLSMVLFYKNNRITMHDSIKIFNQYLV
jgi:hypothetical protein